MPEVVGALASDFGDSASGGGVMPASPQNSALDNTTNDVVRNIGCHVWMPLDKDVIDQVLNAALAKMTTSTDEEKTNNQKESRNSEGGQLKTNDLSMCNHKTAGSISMDENKNKKLKNKENITDHVNIMDVEDDSSSCMNDICGFAASRRGMSTPDSGVSDSRSSGSPALNDAMVPVPRSALDTLITKEFGKFEEYESQSKTQNSTESRVQTVTENSYPENDRNKRDQSSRTNQTTSLHHSPPLNAVSRNTSVIVSRQPDLDTVAASLPKDKSKTSQLNVTLQNQKCRPVEHTAKGKLPDGDSPGCAENETQTWVMVQKATLENMVESAMIKGSCDTPDPAKKADITKMSVKSKPAGKQNEKKIDGSHTAKKRTHTKPKRSVVPSQTYSKRPRISESQAMPSPHTSMLYTSRVNTLQELLQPETDLSVHGSRGHPLAVPQYPIRYVPPPLQSMLPVMNTRPLQVPALLPIHDFDGVGSAFRPPVSAPHTMPKENNPVPKRPRSEGQNLGDQTPLDLSQKEASPTNKPPMAKLPDNNNSAIPAVHRAAPSAPVNNVNGMPVNNQSVPYEPAPSSGVGSVHNTQAKASRLSAESTPTASVTEAKKASPRSDDMGTSSPRGSPWVVLDINQVDNIFDRVLQEEHSPKSATQEAAQINEESATTSWAQNSTQDCEGVQECNKDIPGSPYNFEKEEKRSDKEDIGSVNSDYCSSPQLFDRESSPSLSAGSSGGAPSSPKQGSPGGSGFKWKSDLLRKFNGTTDDSDSSSPRDHSPSPAPSLPRNASFTRYLGDNQNNNNSLPEATNQRQGRNKKKKSKKGKKTSSR